MKSIPSVSAPARPLVAEKLKKSIVIASASLSVAAFLLFPLLASASLFSIPALLQVFIKESSAAGAKQNSQTLSLLSPVTNIDPKAAIGGGDIALVGGSALISEDGPSGTAADIETAMPEATAISVYTVHKGDTLSGIAKMFGVTPNTITWANDIKKGTLKEGMELVILPVTGVRYTVQKGDTVASVAKKYKADATDITQYNTLEGALAVGETIIIPDGEVIVSTPVRSTLSSKAKIPSVRVTGSIAVSGYFSWPVQGGVVTQGIHGYNGIDIGAARGVSIFAAAAGTVIVARDGGGWNGGYGNYIVIKHDNGTQTLYAHANSVSVSSGQYVSQGAVIGTVGNTGKSTGTHLHFEVRGAVNPFGM